MLVIRKANREDLKGIQQLLVESGLYHHDLSEHLQHFLVVESSEGCEILGVAGMEVYHPYGLLRSFVLKREIWKPQIGLQLIQMLLMQAEKLKCDSIFLITNTLAPLFEPLGFSMIQKEELPESIRTSAHLNSSMSHGIPMVYHCLQREGKEAVQVDP
ncbi:GNAT family N-acetyltransferase [Hazenella coriacea]|uniref:N-acetylglutamate synthase-like GNAT family acetyltransferase n=1 Tax=Hazenella coriacea TaxID=1179467 RepID=A0A4R3LDN2_9BACL|nr:hypothetical protein [Hazenella coriacea]TCS95576.1 N-acetylglutamate synthase-like GNAT family acetyltransferase [Hazenella coriacea]